MIGIVNFIGWGLTIALAVGGSFVAQMRLTDNKIERVKESEIQTTSRVSVLEEAINTISKIEEVAKKSEIDTIQRVSKLEEAVVTIKEDTRTIKFDIKEILKVINIKNGR